MLSNGLASVQGNDLILRKFLSKVYVSYVPDKLRKKKKTLT